MPAMLPIVLTASQLVLAADKVPDFNVEPTCRSAAAAAIATDRGLDACRRDEREARARLEQDWRTYPAKQQADCIRLSLLDGQPSYVEVLTCLEIARAASNLPADSRTRP